MAWMIKEWSKEVGKGKIEGILSDPMEFDRTVTEVDDYRVGEEVSVELKRIENNWEIIKIWPEEPRFNSPILGLKTAPRLDLEKQQEVGNLFNKLDVGSVFRTKTTDNKDLAIRIYICCPACGSSKKLLFLQPFYFDWFKHIYPRTVRLSLPQERNYLATKVASFSKHHITVTIIDNQKRFYFIVCSSVKLFRVNRS